MIQADTTNITDTPVPTCQDLTEDHNQQLCMAWHVYRAQQQLHWAQRNLDDLQGKDMADLDLSALGSMKDVEGSLKDWVPKTHHGAVSLLEIVIAIYSHEQIEPGEHFGKGPVFEYLKNLRLSISALSDREARGGDC